jgi:hypothetical protein
MGSMTFNGALRALKTHHQTLAPFDMRAAFIFAAAYTALYLPWLSCETKESRIAPASKQPKPSCHPISSVISVPSVAKKLTATEATEKLVSRAGFLRATSRRGLSCSSPPRNFSLFFWRG